MPDTFIRPDLAQKIQQAAAERSMDVETFIEAAMQTYMRRLEQDELQKNIATFERLLPTLQQKYGNEYIAISNDVVVDHDQSFQAIHHRSSCFVDWALGFDGTGIHRWVLRPHLL